MCEAGMNASTPMETMRPPLTLAFTRPAATEPSGKFGEDVVPILLLLGLVEGEDGIAVLVFEFLDEHLDRGADLELTDVDELVGRDEAFGFAADIDDNFILADFSDRAGDDRANLQLVEGGTGRASHSLTNSYAETRKKAACS